MTAILAGGFGQTAPPPASISITDHNIADATTGTAVAVYQITSGGTVLDQNATALETWLLGGGTASNYEVYVSRTSGSVTAGTLNSWLNLGTTRTWSLTNSARDNSTLTSVLSVQIRLASTGVVQDTATVTLSAESDNLF